MCVCVCERESVCVSECETVCVCLFFGDLVFCLCSFVCLAATVVFRQTKLHKQNTKSPKFFLKK